MAKVYIWLKLPKDFFEKKLIKKMRQLPGGDSCVIVYQRLLSEAALNSGIIEIDGIEDDVSEELALIINEDSKVIKMVLAFCQKYEMVKTLVDSGNLLFPQALEMTGRETDSARRMREKRKKDKEKLASSDVKQIDERHIVTPVLQPVTKRDTELELESELESELELNLDLDIRDRIRVRNNIEASDSKLSLADIIKLYKSSFPKISYGKNTELQLNTLFNHYGAETIASVIKYAANFTEAAPPTYLLKTITGNKEWFNLAGEKRSKSTIADKDDSWANDDQLY